VPNATGQSMIPGPKIVDGRCYNTNNRGFSHDQQADAKITAIVDFDVTAAGVGNVNKRTPPLGTTIQYDCDSGAVLQTKQASNKDVSIGDVAFSAGKVTFAMDGEAANPLISPQQLTPTIKFHGTVTIDTISRAVSWDGTIARFPSYEAYIEVDANPPVTIFQIAPAQDASPWSLLFNNHIDPTVPY
jgi:hypothetical protein